MSIEVADVQQKGLPVFQEKSYMFAVKAMPEMAPGWHHKDVVAVFADGKSYSAILSDAGRLEEC